MKTGTKAGCRAASAKRARTRFGHLEGDREGRHRAVDPVVAGGDDFAREAGDARGGGGDREESGRAGDPARLASGRRLGAEFLAGVEGLGRAQRRRPASIRGLVDRGCRVSWASPSRVSVAIVGGRPEPARRPLRHSTHGQHSLTEEADPTQRARAHGEPAADQHGEDPFPPPRERDRGRRRDAIASEQRSLVSKIDKAVQKGALHKNTGARKKSKAARSPPAPRSSQAGAPRRSPEREGQRQLVAVVGSAAAPQLQVRQRLGRHPQVARSVSADGRPAAWPRRGASSVTTRSALADPSSSCAAAAQALRRREARP